MRNIIATISVIGLIATAILNARCGSPAPYAPVDSSLDYLTDGDRGYQLELAELFRPVLFIHKDDPYNPKEVGIAWSNDSRLCPPDYPRDGKAGEDGCPPGIPTIGQLLTFNHEGYHLDLPGHDRSTYEEEYSKRASRFEDTTYVHVKRDGGYLAVQYWFFYYFNDWAQIGDHEGDWEMIELIFDASDCDDRQSCAKALIEQGKEPVLAAYAQHTCLERRYWNVVDREPEGSMHPRVYVGRGSHASFFGPSGFIHGCQAAVETSGGSGAPSDDRPPVSPRVELLADRPEGKGIEERFAWLLFAGRWGRASNSPDGPRHKEVRWNTPYLWAVTTFGIGPLAPDIRQP